MLIPSAEIFHVGDASGAGTNLRARRGVVRGERREIDVENRGNDGLAVELQKNFAAISVLRKQPGLADVRKIVVFFVRVIFQDGFGLCECGAGKERDADPVVDHAARGVDMMLVIQSMQLFKVELAAVELRFDFLLARIGEAVNVKEMAGEKIGVHARLGFVAVVVEGGESFGLGLVGGSKRRKKAKRGCQQC